MADMRWLKRDSGRQTWQVVVRVPPTLRPVLGNHLKKSTGTSNLRRAQAIRWGIVAQLRKRIDDARAGQSTTGSVIATARALRDQVPVDEDGFEVPEAVTAQAEKIERQQGPATAKAFASVAQGEATPVSQLVDRWLAETPMTAKTEANYRKPINDFLAWNGGEAFAERVTRRAAARWVHEALQGAGQSPATINKKVSALSSFWSWLERRGYAETNPFRGQGVAQAEDRRGNGGTEKERAFTDGEVATLLQHAPDDTMADFLRLLLLTGLRREEAAQLRVQDVDWTGIGPVFTITEGKTSAARRRVPCHSGLLELVERRVRDKDGDSYLMEELTGSKSSRSDPIGKKFTRYRRAVGVQEPTDKARGLVNLHSTRRWFISKAEKADQPPWLIEAVVGHARQGQSLGTYSRGPSDAQLRAVVEAVELPRGTRAK